jgi:hypothetical protein
VGVDVALALAVLVLIENGDEAFYLGWMQDEVCLVWTE